MISEHGHYVQRKKGVEVKYFNSLEEVIHHHQEHSCGLPSVLSHPLSRNMDLEEDDETGIEDLIDVLVLLILFMHSQWLLLITN